MSEPVILERDDWDEFVGKHNELEQDKQRLREALIKLRDCDWVISLPDRMDAVREIAREALKDEREK